MLAYRTCSYDVVHDQHLLSRLDGVLLHLKVVGPVLLLIGGRNARAWQLALLPDRGEAGMESLGEGRAEEETPGVEADENVGLASLATEVDDLQLETVEEGLMYLGIAEEGHDVEEVDTLDGEVGKGPEGAIEAYLPTGEFGGGGGGGGGLSSLVMLFGGDG